MKIQIFDVEHGACALVTVDTGARMLIDCGHNSSTDWRPSDYLPQNGIDTIDMLAVTNYDEDHVSDLPNVLESIHVRSLLRNQTVSSPSLLNLKSETGVGAGIRRLARMIDEYSGGPLEVNWGHLSYQVFCNRYPDDFDDENNLSLVLFLHCYDLHIVFPGDLEEIGWLKLLENDGFRQQLSQINVFVASHHGRESGCCDKVFEYCKPAIILMSDKATQHDTQRTAGWYGQRAAGIPYHGQQRYVFTTRQDGRLLLTATSTSTTIDTIN